MIGKKPGLCVFFSGRKGSIPITIFVIGIFILCIVALVSFIVARSGAVNIVSNVVLMEKLNFHIEDYAFHKDLGRVDTYVNSNHQRVFYQEKIDSKFWPWQDDKVIFSVEYPLR